MAKLICPLCDAFTSPTPVEFNAEVTIQHVTGWTSRTGEATAVVPDEYGQPTYGILVCQACEKRFVAQKNKSTDEWSAVYPIKHKPVAKEVPEPIRGEFEEANLCFAVGAYRGCLLVCKTVLIALQREQNVSSLDELKENGIISPRLYDQSDEIRLWANMIGHEDIRQDITKEDCDELLAYLEALLNAVYVEPKRLSSLTQKRKQLKKKQ